RENPAVLDASIRLYIVDPDCGSIGIAMVQQLPIRTEPEAISDLDTIPELGDGAVGIDSEEAARAWFAIARQWIEIQRTSVDTAAIIGSQIVEAHQRFAFPTRKNI